MVASAVVNSRCRSAGVRSSDATKRSIATTSMPTPTTRTPDGTSGKDMSGGYSTVTDLARLRGLSMS